MNGAPLKILLSDPHLKGGGQVRYVTNLARQLAALGHEAGIACKRDSVLVSHARSVGYPVYDAFFLRGGARPWAWKHDLREAVHLIRRCHPDIVHVNGSQDHWVFALANRFLGCPCCVVRTRHNTYPVHDGLANRMLNRRWTDYQIVVCETVRKTLARQRAFDPARLCAIHNGVDADLYAPDDALRRRVRAELGYGDEHVVCGIAARLVEAKGHAFLLRAAAMLRPEFPNVRLLILGQGDKEAALRMLAKNCGVAEITHFAGFRDDMHYCTQAFDIGVQPSIDCDTSSFSLKEQMAAQKPVVASDYGGLTEIVTDGVEGLVVPAGTVEPLARALRRLASDPDLRVRMGRAGRERVLRDFTVQVFGARTAEAYARAIEIHRLRRI